MIKLFYNILKKNVYYFFFSGKNSKQFNKLAQENMQPEQVDGYVAKYTDINIKIFSDAIIKKFKTEIGQQDSVLEIGCGTGRYLNAIKEFLKNPPHGIDISLNTIEKYTNKHDGIIAFHGDFVKYNFNKRYNFIYSITTLQYIPFFRLTKFIKKIYKVLEEEGKVFIQFPYSKGNKFALLENFNYTKYPIDYVVKKCKKEGFEILESGELKIIEDINFSGGAYLLIKKNASI